MSDESGQVLPDWDLDEWEKALTINVGTTYVCRRCENVAIVTKGGVGVMEMVCCGKEMEKLAGPKNSEEGGAR